MFQGNIWGKLDEEFPRDPVFDPQYRRVFIEGESLTPSEITLAVKNVFALCSFRMALSVFSTRILKNYWPEEESRPIVFVLKEEFWGRPIDEYKGITPARGIQVMIDNNLDFEVALYPYELVTYGESGQVCQNWRCNIVLSKNIWK